MKTTYHGKASFLERESDTIACRNKETLKTRLKVAFEAIATAYLDYEDVYDCGYGEIEIVWHESGKLYREMGRHAYGNWIFTVTEFNTIGGSK